MSWKISPSVKRSITTAMTWTGRGAGKARGDCTSRESRCGLRRTSGARVIGAHESEMPSAPPRPLSTAEQEMGALLWEMKMVQRVLAMHP